ncbi:MAG: hypothetical protein J5I90_08935 [Caldilineales bacterium]|nr:hypothetical protein [Caldilineales bacterium]
MKLTKKQLPVLFVLGIALCLMLLWAATPVKVAAAPFYQEGGANEPCATCHWSEDGQWQHSPHGLNNVACEDCHGPYVEGHPDEGMMKLTSDGSQCRACHSDTEAQWEESQHAKSGINCTNCHVAHSQTTRLASERLCLACHEGETEHAFDTSAHSVAGVTCVECHLAEPTGALSKHASHDFIAVSPQLCLDCHVDSIHAPASVSKTQSTAKAAIVTQNEQVQNLAKQLEETKGSNTTLKALTIVMLGVGLGVGVMFGLIFMLVIGKFV